MFKNIIESIKVLSVIAGGMVTFGLAAERVFTKYNKGWLPILLLYLIGAFLYYSVILKFQKEQ